MTARTLTSPFCVFLASFVVVTAGCGDDVGEPMDLGPVRDAIMVVDGPLSDSGASDIGTPEVDMSGPVCPGICRPDLVSGCTGGTATCVLEGAEPRCAASTGTLEAGTPCEDADQCAPGYGCFQRRTGGVCGRICCTDDPESCTVGQVCRGTGILVDGVATGYGECQEPRTCDVLAAPVEACQPGEGCYIIDAEETACLAAGTGETADGCDAPNDCAPGFSCVGAFDGTCARICRLGRPEDCQDGEGTCVAYAQSPDGTGLCTPDP